MGLYRILIFTIALFGSAACSFRQSKAPPVEPNFASIQSRVFLPKCASCHAPGNPQGHEIVLTTYKAMQLSNSSFVNGFLTPGDPENSRLYQVLISSDSQERMPKNGKPLPQQAVDAIYQWIKNGAKETEDGITAPTKVPLPTDDPPIPDGF